MSKAASFPTTLKAALSISTAPASSISRRMARFSRLVDARALASALRDLHTDVLSEADFFQPVRPSSVRACMAAFIDLIESVLTSFELFLDGFGAFESILSFEAKASASWSGSVGAA